VSLGRAPDQDLAAWASRIADDVLKWDDVFAPFDGKFREDLLLAGSEVAPVLLRECTEQAVRVQPGENKTVKNGPFYQRVPAGRDDHGGIADAAGPGR
jgi:hypothetical protein